MKWFSHDMDHLESLEHFLLLLPFAGLGDILYFHGLCVGPVYASLKMVRPITAETQQQVQANRAIREVTAPSRKTDDSVKERHAPQVRQRTAAVKRPVQSYPEAQADYGWLAAAIWQQIEKYKREPLKTSRFVLNARRSRFKNL